MNEAYFDVEKASNELQQSSSNQQNFQGDIFNPEISSEIPIAKKIVNAHFCEFRDPLKGQCKQRAINSFKYCIRHILLDPIAPYKQCQHRKKPKNKHEQPVLCTNAIRASSSEIYCSTHLIMNGMKDPKNSTKKEAKNNMKVLTNNELDMSLENSKTMNPAFFNHQCQINSIKQEIKSTSSLDRQEHLFFAQTTNEPQNNISNAMETNSSLQQFKTKNLLIVNKHIPGIRSSGSPAPAFVISKSHPQLAAKLLQEVDSQQHSQLKQILVRNEEASSIVLADKLKNVKSSIDINRHSHSMIQQKSESKFTHYPSASDTLSVIGAISSPLYFINNEPPPRRYDLDKLEKNLLCTENEEENELLKFQRDYSNDFDSAIPNNKRKIKVIKLRQKQAKIRIEGAFRRIRTVDSMCRVVENYDFDGTDLFPLGLEPSDDESSSDSDFTSFDESKSQISSSEEHSTNNRLELYLLKKKLRLESARLVQRAKLCIPINAASRQYVNSVGAALRVRKANMSKENGKMKENRVQQCAHVTQQQITRDGKVHFMSVPCANLCLPWSKHCSEHISYNVSQHLFSYCKWRLCNTPVSLTDNLLFDGYCKHHYTEQQRFDTHQLHPSNMAETSTTLQNNIDFNASSSKSDEASKMHQTDMGRHANPTFDIYRIPYTNRDDHLNDVVDGDVSLASVAKDLGFDGRELTDMLERLPVEEPFETEMEADEENLLSGINKDDSDEVPPGVAIGHSWADVEQFLLEQEHHSISDESTPQF